MQVKVTGLKMTVGVTELDVGEINAQNIEK